MYKKEKKVLDMSYVMRYDEPVTHTLLMHLMPSGFAWLADIENEGAVDNDSLALATAMYSLRHYGPLGPRDGTEYLQ